MFELELILPCYNEAKSLEALVQRAALAAQAAGFGPTQVQFVLVENGSTDNSASTLETLAAGPLGVWFRVVRVSVNQGYGFGLWSGLQTTSAKMVAWSHADQQCDPADVFRALKLAGPGIVVKGVRTGRNWKDRVVSRVFEVFSLVLLGKRIYEINAQPKVFPRALLSEIKNPPKTFAFDLYVLYRALRAGYVFKTVTVLFPPRIHGVSNWASNFFSRYRTILGMIRYMWSLRREPS